MRMRQFFIVLLMAAAPIVAFADTTDFTSDTTNTVPEPETLALLGVATMSFLIARKIMRE